MAEPSDGTRRQMDLSDHVRLTVNLLPTRLVWPDKLPWLLSGDSLNSR